MKKEIRIDELRVMMLDALTLRGIGSEDAAFIVDDFLDAELEGHKTHGVSKFLTLDIGLSGRESGIEIVRQTGGHAKIDGAGDRFVVGVRLFVCAALYGIRCGRLGPL